MERRIAILGPGPYGGMDRPPLDDVRAIELESSGDVEALRAFVAEREGHEVLGLGDFDGPEWEFLGYDVGETTSAAWSAVLHRDQVLPGREVELNAHGLFDRRDDATAFLRAYLEADDPDAGWSAQGWTSTPTIYAVVPIHRLRLSSLP